MNVALRRLSLLLTILTLLSSSLFAAKVNVEARLDSAQVLMGNVASLKVEVSRIPGAPGVFPQFRDCPEQGYVSFLGDTIEMSRPRLVDSLVRGGREILSYDIPVQVFDSGYYRLPEILYVSGGDTARSAVLSLKVVPVAVSANDSIAPFSPVLDPDGFSVFDWVPDWILDYWWIILLLVLAILVFLWAMRRYRSQGSLLPPKPLSSPYKQAVSRLEALKNRKLWEKGMEKEYFTELTDILRVYLFRRFGINAMEMTSRQIMETLSERPEAKEKRSYMRNILNMADFVKFAKVRPLPADNVAAYEDAVKFVEETRPSPEEEQLILEREMALAASAAPASGSAPASKGRKRKKSKSFSRKSKK